MKLGHHRQEAALFNGQSAAGQLILHDGRKDAQCARQAIEVGASPQRIAGIEGGHQRLAAPTVFQKRVVDCGHRIDKAIGDLAASGADLLSSQKDVVVS
mgnify:CR=1 FL=1